MANPFKDWTPQMVEAFNRRRRLGLGVISPNLFAKAWGEDFAKTIAANPVAQKPRKPLLNKTESRFLDLLKAEQPNKYVGCQNITFLLAPDLRYTPDFWIAYPDAKLTFWEVKGAFIREDGMVKLKTAAAMFPMFIFIMAQWKDGKWTTKTIPPL